MNQVVQVKIKKACPFCTEGVSYIDYKNLKVLSKFISRLNKIVPRYYSGVCLNHQKKLARAIKNARIMALLPFVK